MTPFGCLPRIKQALESKPFMSSPTISEFDVNGFRSFAT